MDDESNETPAGDGSEDGASVTADEDVAADGEGAPADAATPDEESVPADAAPPEDDDDLLRAVIDRAGGLDRLWGGVVGTLAAALVFGSILFSRTVYVGFVWQYFWGPVYADAHGWDAVEWCGGKQVEGGTCDPSTVSTVGPVAEPGYTIVSEIGYAVILLLMLVGVAILVQRLRITRYRAGYFALLPFMFFGGALRVVEDAADAGRRVGAETIGYPLNSLFISPVIYFTVFAVAVFGIVLAKYLEHEWVDRGYEYPFAAVGTVALAATLAYLVYLSATKSYVDFHPAILLVTATVALASTGAVWWAIGEYAPDLNQGTGKIGLLVILGQAVDGAANVIGLDWAEELGLGSDLIPKHPANEFVVNTTAAVLPASVTNVTGDAWPFLLLKLVAAVLVIWIFDESVFQEESERFTMLLLVAVLAVGLGPGTRDMLRATFGI